LDRKDSSRVEREIKNKGTPTLPFSHGEKREKGR